MAFNFRNAEFGAENIEQGEQSSFSFNQSSGQFMHSSNNQRSAESTSGFTFSHVQRQEIADIVAAALRTNRQNNSSSFMPSVSSLSTTTLSSFDSRPDRWNAVDLGFFDLTYDGKIVATDEFIQHAGKDTYFRDVHLFVDRAKDIALAKEAKTIRNNLYICFRGQVMTWFTAEIFSEGKELIKIENNLDV
jgi:hypothetical protein